MQISKSRPRLSSRFVVPLNGFLIRWLNLGSARSWQRFANSSCPVRTHHASFVLNDLQRSQLRQITSFAVYCAPRFGARTLGLDLAAAVIERAFKKNLILHSAR